MKLFSKPLTLLMAVLGLMMIPVAVLAGPAEEAFVRTNTSAGLAILQDDTLDEIQKTEQFGQFIDQVVDGRKISRFVLGKYARGLDKQIFSSFQGAFTAYAKNIYQDNLTQFGGEVFNVTGSVDRKPGDSVVSTILSGGSVEKPLKVRWRIRTRKGVSKVIDLEAFGVWVALQQRSEITSYIANHQGDVSAVTTMLMAKIDKPIQNTDPSAVDH